jgi:O-antigen/teichoic acid export membrane protein
MPVLFRKLGKEELGLWLLLGQSWAALGIFDLGFGVTLTRRIAFAKGKGGSDPDADLTVESLTEIADLVATGRRVYHALSVFTFIFSFAAGFFYLKNLNLSSVTLSQVWLAWGSLCLSQAFGVWGRVWTCVLQGVGYIGWDTLVVSIINALTLGLQIVMVLFGGGLVSLAIVAAAGALAQRSVILQFARGKRPELFAICGQWRQQIARSMVPLALRAWLTALGASLVLYTDQILIAARNGASGIPAYRAAFVLVHNLTVLAVTLGLASGVFISHLWQAGEFGQVRRILQRNVRLGWLIMLTGAACLLVIGEPLFGLWLGKGNFAGYAILSAFLLTETLDTQSQIIASASRATEDEAFALSSLTGGLLKLLLSWWLATTFGLLGIALGTTLGLLLTNHWYMVYRGLRRLQISIREYVRKILCPCLLTFPLMLLSLAGLRRLLMEKPPLAQVAAVAALGLVLFALAAWRLLLEPSQRLQAMRAIACLIGNPTREKPGQKESRIAKSECAQ